eukprot:2157826-Amphidinium_carterae.1
MMMMMMMMMMIKQEECEASDSEKMFVPRRVHMMQLSGTNAQVLGMCKGRNPQRPYIYSCLCLNVRHGDLQIAPCLPFVDHAPGSPQKKSSAVLMQIDDPSPASCKLGPRGLC